MLLVEIVKKRRKKMYEMKANLSISNKVELNKKILSNEEKEKIIQHKKVASY